MRDAFRRGLACFRQRKVGDARALLRRVVERGGDEAPWACQQLVQTFIQRGQWARAQSALEAAPMADESLRALGFGYLHRRAGALGEARRCLHAAASGGVAAEAARVELAGLVAGAGEMRAGLDLLRRSERAFRRRGDRWGLAAALYQRASLALERGEAVAALALSERAAALRVETGDSLGVGSALQTKAKALYRLSRYSAAVAVLEQALALHERCGHELEAAVVLNNIGLWHLDLANPGLAAERFRRARRTLVRHGDRAREAAVVANLGNAYVQLDLAGAATRAYERALALIPAAASEARGIAIVMLAEVHSRRGRPDLALRLLAAETPGLRSASAATIGLCGVEEARARLLLGDPGGAARTAAQAQRRVSGAGPGEHAGAMCEIRGGIVRALALLARGRRASAALVLTRLEAALESLLDRQEAASVRMGLVEAYREVHDAYIQTELVARPAGPRRAWQAASRFKARELLRPRGDRGAATARGSPPPAPLLEYHVGVDTTLLFLVEEGRVTAIDLELGERQLAAAVTQLLKPLRAAGSSGDPRPDLLAFDLEAAARLHAALLAPALERIAGSAARLVVVPDGPLHALPFEILVSRIDPQSMLARAPLAHFGGARYAMEDHALSYARSSRLVRRPFRSRRPPASVFGMAFSPARPTTLATPDGPLLLGSLSRARDEVRAVGALFPRACILDGVARVEDYSRRARAHEVIHLAAHAYADAREPDASGIVLAGDANGRSLGFLTAEDIRGQRLRARLVTLSACNSGSGLVRTREGAIGLARAFLEAGAEAVLATLWPVDDDAALELMVAFYRRVLAGETRAAALAAAKREIRSECGRHLFPRRAHPYYWAPFVLIDHRPE